MIFVNLSGGHDRLGGSVLARCYQRLGSNYPDVEPTLLLDGFKAVQELVVDGLIVSLHDRSDGGLITTLCEMAFGGNVGLEINLWNTDTTIPTFFSEELGLVMECPDPEVVVDHLQEAGLPAAVIGTVGDYGGNITIIHNDLCVLDESMVDLRYIWQETSIKLDELQTNPELVAQSASARRNLVNPPPRRLTFEPVPTHPEIMGAANKPKVAVVREQGSNGDAEMRSAFYAAGFEVWDVHMNDLRQCRFSLDSVQGCVFPGGFAYGDVLDSAKGWAGGILFNNHLAEEFDRFYHRPDTFSLGVCNGAQLMALLGWVPQPVEHDFDKYRFIRNRSGRFESDFVTVEIQPSPAIMLAGMAGSQLGVWVAHGEGYLYVPEEDDEGLTELIEDGLTPLLYIGPDGEPTTTYPFNPNGSPVGITALCTPDGRHLAMMPHPERSANQLWQMPWMPPEWESLQASPWLWMFQNAYYWCMAQQQNALV